MNIIPNHYIKYSLNNKSEYQESDLLNAACRVVEQAIQNPNLDSLDFKRVNHPFGSMPRVESSLRIMRFIQAEAVASPSASIAFFIADSNSGSILKAICLFPRGKFTLFVFDTCFISMYYQSCVRHCKTQGIKKQTPKYAGTFLSVLTTTLKDLNIMANSNYITGEVMMTSTACIIKAVKSADAKMRSPVIQGNFQNCDTNHFTTPRTLDYFNTVLAKSKTEPENSNDRQLAHDTPRLACFFMRKIRTPQEDTPLKNQERNILSMVACDGKGFALCCVPCVAVSQPVARYRPNPEKFSGNSYQSAIGVTAMIYLFAGIKRLDRTNKIHSLRISAISEREARASLARDYVLVFTGQINRTFAVNQCRNFTSELFSLPSAEFSSVAVQGVIYA